MPDTTSQSPEPVDDQKLTKANHMAVEATESARDLKRQLEAFYVSLCMVPPETLPKRTVSNLRLAIDRVGDPIESVLIATEETASAR